MAIFSPMFFFGDSNDSAVCSPKRGILEDVGLRTEAALDFGELLPNAGTDFVGVEFREFASFVALGLSLTGGLLLTGVEDND